MGNALLVAPILPDKENAWRAWSRELMEEPRRSEMVAFMKNCGLTRDRCWIQPGPGVALSIVLYEGETPEMFLQQIATSQEPFAIWFRQKVKVFHGIDLSEPSDGPMPEMVTDISMD